MKCTANNCEKLAIYIDFIIQISKKSDFGMEVYTCVPKVDRIPTMYYTTKLVDDIY